MSTWNTSRSPTTRTTVEQGDRQVLQRSQGEDHTVTSRHRLSLHRYPPDCPPLKVRWFYAVDSPKWKPTSLDQKRDNNSPLPSPKKFVPFSSKDSQAIENAFQKLSDLEMEREQIRPAQPYTMPKKQQMKVPVNEDYLFDVDVERRELSPAYWIGPVYEVRRGTWFIQDGSSIKPCEENLATQLEEGYLKVRPYAFETGPDKLHRPSPGLGAEEKAEPRMLPTPSENIGHASSTSSGENRNYRLFGAYMNSIATYQDVSTALLTNDDFMSRVSTTFYQKLGGVPGTKLIRGFFEMRKQREYVGQKDDKATTEEVSKSKNPTLNEVHGPEMLRTGETQADTFDTDSSQQSPRSALERQMSSLAGEPQNAEDLEEEARRQEEKEMEDSREHEGDDRDREIDHLVLVTHGIGQRLGLRLESINFIHDVNVLRKTMKSVYKGSPDLQSLNSEYADKHRNCRVQVLPVCWRHLLDFPYQGVRQNRRELDLADAGLEDDAYPGLADITLDSVPAVRNLISDLAMDVLLYQSAYCEHISNIVRQECNRILKLFMERNPSFKGSVSLCGHSLGSAILFDILCHEQAELHAPKQGDTSQEQHLEFECEELFCLGSPIALFQMLKGKTVSGRSWSHSGVGTEPLSPTKESMKTPSDHVTSRGEPGPPGKGTAVNDAYSSVISSPRCRQLFNIFHPSDPVSYRIEPLISSEMSSLRPQLLPSVKRSLWTSSGQSLSMIGSRVGQSVGSLWANFTTGVASSLLNRSLGLNPEDNSGQAVAGTGALPQPSQPQANSDTDSQQKLTHRRPTLIDQYLETLYERSKNDQKGTAAGFHEGNESTNYEEKEKLMKKLKTEDLKVRSLNSNGRVDYSIQEGAFDISLIASIASHLTYWADEDVNHFILSQMLARRKPRPA